MNHPLLAALLLFSATIAWTWVKLPRLIDLTATIAGWCDSLLTRCVAYAAVLGASVMWAGVILLAAGLLYATFKGIASIIRARRNLGRLPVARAGNVALIKDDDVAVAFTWGLLRPRIYVSTGLISRLSREEVRGVVYHEMHHRRSLDPLRFLLLDFLKDAFFYVPMVKYLASRHRSRKEAAADDAAIRRSVHPLTLAGALLKASPSALSGGRSINLSPASFSGSLEARVKRLVGEGEAGPLRLPLRATAVSALTATLLVLSVALPLSSAAYDPGRCDMDHCDAHSVSIVEDCKAHCSVHIHQ